ncbi:hypothetical protein CTAM01_08616 [Colletotrichum tamarilloi]|uniref:Uncharacterized protein n=1 Tax=Colletotrichum tamarilloi TaxID=1209934 RepID=A0ABQ9R628_9PEZI|nr:uncharacterized protein CTAM01_08616 [Colletotrichum tamarilloi]KAK1495487.1 hypothetical protein CTAM01_08616 [Colletotrichum tamarilloi]
MPPPPPRRATLPPSPRGWVEQTVSAYNLKWPDLRRYLIGLYQITDGRRLNERQVRTAVFIPLTILTTHRRCTKISFIFGFHGS